MFIFLILLLTPSLGWSATYTREIQFPLRSFFTGDVRALSDGESYTGDSIQAHMPYSGNITSSSAPRFVADPISPAVVWLREDPASPAVVTFRVPTNYQKGGAFRGIFSETTFRNGGIPLSEISPAAVAYELFVHQDGGASQFGFRKQLNTDILSQEPVTLADTAGLMEEVNLPIGGRRTSTDGIVSWSKLSDESVLVAGDWVTLRIGRQKNGSTNSLKMHFLEFYYTPKW